MSADAGFVSSERVQKNGTELDYMYARYYGPENLFRFLSVDPILGSAKPNLPQSWNRSAYVLNNPILMIDPDGESAKAVTLPCFALQKIVKNDTAMAVIEGACFAGKTAIGGAVLVGGILSANPVAIGGGVWLIGSGGKDLFDLIELHDNVQQQEQEEQFLEILDFAVQVIEKVKPLVDALCKPGGPCVDPAPNPFPWTIWDSVESVKEKAEGIRPMKSGDF